MTGTEDTGTPIGAGGRDDPVEVLLRQAPPRERPDPRLEQALRDRLRGEWRELTGRRKRRRRVLVTAMAASLLLALIAVLRAPPEPGPRTLVAVATVERIRGQFIAAPANGGVTRRLTPGSELHPDERIAGDAGSGMALRWNDGPSIRVDQRSALTIETGGAIQLESGVVYVDTNGIDSASDPLVITTPAGQVRHLGTRYMIAVDGDTTEVSVRAGKVELLRQQTAIEVDSGERLAVSAGGHSRIDAIEVFGPEWDWVEPLADGFDLDGRSLADFLQWVSRETGLSVEYEDVTLEAVAADTELRGSVDLPPMQALELVLQTSDLIAEVNYGIIRISPRYESLER